MCSPRLEEAYNQTAGVVQHISVFVHDPDTDAWAFTFTQEWPAPAQAHQLSATIPLEHDGDTRLGDVSLNAVLLYLSFEHPFGRGR